MIDYERKHTPARSASEGQPSLALLAGLLDEPVQHIDWIQGGFSATTCEVVMESGAEAVLKWRPPVDRHKLAMELACADFANEHGVRTPEVIARGEHWMLMRRVNGVRVDTLLEDVSMRAHWEYVGRACAEVLVTLHDVSHYNVSGFLNPDMSICEELGGAGTGMVPHMLGWLDSPLMSTRLDRGVVCACRALIHEQEAAWRWLDEDGARLVHSDFNTKNLMAEHVEGGGWRVTVLDWEYAFAGSRFMDVGNFMRFGEERPGVAQAFAQHYGTHARGVPGNWRELAYLCDLCSMLSMMMRPELSARSLATVEGVVRMILSKF